MESKSLFWSLFNDQTDRQIDGLTFTQVTGFLDSLPKGETDHWLAWHEGLASWKKVADFAELLEKTRIPRQSRPTPPSPRAKPAAESAPESTGTIPVFELDETTETIRIDNKGHQDNRFNRRFHLKWTIGVYVGGSWIKNESVDVSLGGTKLRDPLPNGLQGRVVARVINPNGEQLDLNSMVMKVHNQPPNRLRFQMTSEQEEVMRTWLLSAHDEA